MKHQLRWLTVLVILGILNAAPVLSAATELGFPLADAWIHQVRARSLGTRGTMTFNEGQQSTGSTAPAWSLLLAVAYLGNVPLGLHLGNHGWDFVCPSCGSAQLRVFLTCNQSYNRGGSLLSRPAHGLGSFIRYGDHVFHLFDATILLLAQEKRQT